MAKAKSKSKVGQDIMANLKANLAKGKATKADAKASTAKVKAAAWAAAKHLVDVTVTSHSSVRDALMEMKGKDALFLAEARNGLKQAWKDYADTLTARGTHSDNATLDQVKRASIYNRNSEQQAVLSAFEKYAAANKAIKKEFDKRLRDCTSYHSLIAFTRHFNRGNKTSKQGTDTAAKRERKAWQNKTRERIQKVKQTLRFATLDALTVLADYIEARIKQEKRSLEQQSSGKAGTVSKMRKAA